MGVGRAPPGTVVKRYFAQQWERPVEDIYHLALYACFDKKLEVARRGSVVFSMSDCVFRFVDRKRRFN